MSTDGNPSDALAGEIVRPPSAWRKIRPMLWITLIVAVLAGLGYLWRQSHAISNLWEQLTPARTASESFLIAIKQKQLPRAYGSTSAAFRAQHTLEEFSAIVASQPALAEHRSRFCHNVYIALGAAGKHAIAQWTLQMENEPADCSIIMAMEDGDWKVHGFSFP